MIGQLAHIHGLKPGSPRYEPTMADEERNSYSNLLILCKTHHDLIDRFEPNSYPADRLRMWKLQREAQIRSLFMKLKASAVSEGETSFVIELSSGRQALVHGDEIHVDTTDLAMDEGDMDVEEMIAHFPVDSISYDVQFTDGPGTSTWTILHFKPSSDSWKDQTVARIVS